jgi:hypothetical protein
MRLINKNNFLLWYSSATEAADISDLPNGYIQDRSRCNYQPLLIAGEAMRFYINALDGLSDIITVDTATLKLKLYNSRTGIVTNANVSPLQVDEFGTTFTLYSEVVIDGSIPPGDYYFTIEDNATTYLTSSLIKVVSAGSDYRNYTARCTFIHDRYFYGFNYQNVTTFEQQFRLHFNKIDLQEETDIDVYNEVTTGKQRTFNAFMKLPVKLESYYFDEEAHRAAIVMFGHSSIFINGKQYVKKSPYKINTNPTQKTVKGEIELYDQEFATANRCILPPEDIAVCDAVALPVLSYPNAIVGTPYSYSFTLTGTAPYSMTVLNQPSWMTTTLVGAVVTSTGTPDTDGEAHVDINFANCSVTPVNLDKTFTVEAASFDKNYYIGTTFVSSNALNDSEIANLEGIPGTHVQVTLDFYTNTNGGQLQINGVDVTSVGEVFNYTLDGTGHKSFDADIFGLSGHAGSVILGRFRITSVDNGSIGTPDLFQISKVFS